MSPSPWNEILEEALKVLSSSNLTRYLRPIETCHVDPSTNDHQVFEELQPWDRRSVEVTISPSTLSHWLLDPPYPDASSTNSNLILFSGNDYLGLSTHPSIARAAAQAASLHGMGPRGSALICGYTTHHKLLETSLANLKKKESCLLCPTGFSANMAVLTALGSFPSLLNSQPIAVFSDALNHASIIDGLRLAASRNAFVVHVYRHCDTSHLTSLLANCKLQNKVVVSDSLFSMDGDIAPLAELVNLKKTYGFLLVIDDAHGTFVCGENGGGVPELFGCEDDVDICVGTLSKAAGCHGGFITCTEKWKLLIQSRGRAFIFSTAVPIPLAAAADAAVTVAREERWRRARLWERVRQFQMITGFPVWSPIISIVVGSEENALKASRHLVISGFHVSAIRPPTVAPNSCRLRVTLSAAHTEQDVRNLCAALATCTNLRHATQAKL